MVFYIIILFNLLFQFMKVFKMEFQHTNNTAQSTTNDVKISQARELARKMLDLLKDDSKYSLQNCIQLIKYENVPMLTKILHTFLSTSRTDRDSKRPMSAEKEKDLLNTIDKQAKKLTEASVLIDHLKEKLKKKEAQLNKKQEMVVSMKKDNYEGKFRKFFITNQLSDSSNFLLQTLQPFTQTYGKQVDLAGGMDFRKKDVFFSRTSSQEINQNNIFEETIHGNKMWKSNRSNGDLKLPIKVLRRDHSVYKFQSRPEQYNSICKQNQIEIDMKAIKKPLSPRILRN